MNSINRFVFVMETHFVLCEIEIQFLSIIMMNFRLQSVKVAVGCNI
jgi:hypothetical protein